VDRLENPVPHCAIWRESWPLVDAEENPPELVWRGSEPVAFSRAIAALREESIPHRPTITADHLAFGIATPRPKLELFVFRSDGARAREALAGLVDPAPLLSEEPPPPETEDSATAGADAAPLIEPFAPTSRDTTTESPYQQRRRFVQFGAACVCLALLTTFSLNMLMGSARGGMVPPTRLLAIYIQVFAALIADLVGLATLWRVFYGSSDKLASVARLFFYFGILWLMFIGFTVSLHGGLSQR
jgi:hypothetical protein